MIKHLAIKLTQLHYGHYPVKVASDVIKYGYCEHDLECDTVRFHSMSLPEPKFMPLNFRVVPEPEQGERATEFLELMASRRTVREYSDAEVPFELIEKAIATAGTAPSGANMQPWRFVVVKDAEVKRKIREAAEKEEYESYHGRMTEKWLRRLAPLGTDEHKPFLEIAPYLIVVFRINSI